MAKLKAVQSTAAPVSAPAGSLWYIEMQSARCRIGLLRRQLAEQGIRRVETITDRVIRCWATCAPVLPAEWGCIVTRSEQDAPGPPPVPAMVAGDLVRLRSGPVAGFVGRVQAVRGDKIVVQILVWGKGMIVEASATDADLIDRPPWERNGDGRV